MDREDGRELGCQCNVGGAALGLSIGAALRKRLAGVVTLGVLGTVVLSVVGALDVSAGTIRGG